MITFRGLHDEFEAIRRRTVQLETICVDFGSIAMNLGRYRGNSVTYKAICDDL